MAAWAPVLRDLSATRERVDIDTSRLKRYIPISMHDDCVVSRDVRDFLDYHLAI